MWSVIFARLAMMFVVLSVPYCNSLGAQAQTVITLPCGVSSRYTSSNATDGMMLVIRRCAGSRIVNGAQVLITTSLTLNFNSSTLSAPKNISVLIENCVNVNLQVSGGTGINLNRMSVLSGFNLTMKNVTNPSSPKPPQACTATSTLLWCASLVYFRYVSFQDSTITLDTITFDRSSAVASVLQIYNTSQLQNVVVTLVNVTHYGSHPVVNVDAAQAGIVASAASNFNLLMMHVTVYTSGIVAAGRIIGVFLWISQLSLVDTSIVLHDVEIDDGGLSGQASGVLLSSLPPSRNVSVTYINAVVSFIGATYYGAYVVDSDMSSSTFLFQNHTLYGGDLAVMYAIAVFTTSLSFNSVVAVSDIQIMSGASNLVAFRACTLSNSIVNISNIELQASINGGTLATITYTTSNGVGSLISDMAISISDCYCAVGLIGSMAVLRLANSVIQRATIDTFNVTLDGDSGMGVVISGSPATVEQLHVVIRQCWLLVEYPVFISSMNVSNSTVTVLDTVLVPLTNYATVLQNMSTSQFYFNLMNVTVGSSSSRSVSAAILVFIVVSLWDRETIAVINCTQGSMHAGPMLDMESVMFSGQSTISLELLGQLVLATVNSYVVFVTGCSLLNHSSIRFDLPPAATSLRSVATYTPFQIQETSFTSGSTLIIDGGDGGGAAVQWSATVSIIMLSNLLLIDSSSVIMKNVNLRNTLANRQYPATFGVIVQNSRFIGNSSLTMQNVNMTLANVSSSTFTVQQVGINLLNTTFDASHLITQAIRCLDRVNELIPPIVDPGFAFCLLLQKVAARNSSELIVSRITSISTSAFRVLQLEDCAVSGQSFVTLLEASLISLVPSKRVVLGGATIVNKVVCLMRFISSQDSSISVLSNSTVVAKNDTQVGPAADLMLVLVINCTLTATDVRLTNVFITFPDAQCATATTSSIVIPTADVLRVTNATFTLGTTVTLTNVIVRNLSYCSSFAVVEFCTVSAALLMYVSGISTEYSPEHSSNVVLRRASVNISYVDVFGAGTIVVTISNFTMEACAVCILLSSVRALITSPAPVTPLVQLFVTGSVFQHSQVCSTTSANCSLEGSVLMLSNVTSVGTPIRTTPLARIELTNTTVELQPGMSAFSCDSNTSTSLDVLIGPNSRIVSTAWPFTSSNYSSAAPTLVSSVTFVNVTLDRAVLIGAMKVFRRITSSLSPNSSQSSVAVAVYCSQWGRHSYSPLSLIGQTSKAVFRALELDRGPANTFFVFSKTNPSHLCSVPQRLSMSGELTNSREASKITVSVSTAETASNTGRRSSTKFFVAAAARPAPIAQQFFSSISAVTITSGVSSALSSAVGTALVRTVFTAQLADCAGGSVDSIFSGDNGGNNFFNLQIGDQGADGYGYRSSLAGFLIVIIFPTLFGATISVTLWLGLCGNIRRRTLRGATAAAALPGWWLAGPCAAAVGPLLSSGISLASVSAWSTPAVGVVILLVVSFATAIMTFSWSVIALLKPTHRGIFVCKTEGRERTLQAKKRPHVSTFLVWLLDGGYVWAVDSSLVTDPHAFGTPSRSLTNSSTDRMYPYAYGSLFSSMKPNHYWHFLLDMAANIVAGILAAVPAIVAKSTDSDHIKVRNACNGALHATTVVQLIFAAYFIARRPVAVRWELIAGACMATLGGINALLASIQATSLASDTINDWGNAVQSFQLAATGVAILCAVSEGLFSLFVLNRRRGLLANPIDIDEEDLNPVYASSSSILSLSSPPSPPHHFSSVASTLSTIAPRHDRLGQQPLYHRVSPSLSRSLILDALEVLVTLAAQKAPRAEGNR
ncbi:Hypothetical protein, putative [Bodo saltans]|uniref:Membrane-associated protein n=1 Tax=Bodo saltans TaxID=75058 RepID=A0A0S4J3S4_BODSA|nr:Hypothetical protein, putative [Bodo saltans]|eukprot:CUG71553.1 Hypothetical protein, putative [Bodo saltans]